MNAAEFVERSEGLGVCFNVVEDEEGKQDIEISGKNNGIISDRVLIYLRAKKPEVLAHLDERIRQSADQIDQDAVTVARVEVAYRAARAGEMGCQFAQLGPGTSTADAGDWYLRAVARCQRVRRGVPSLVTYAEYLDRTLTERMGIESVANWWAEKIAGGETTHRNEGNNKQC